MCLGSGVITLGSTTASDITSSPPALSPPPSHHHHPTTTSYAQSSTAPVKRSAPFDMSSITTSKKRAVDLAQSVPNELGEFIDRDAKLLRSLGWRGLVRHRRPTGDFASLTNVHHPARRLLQHYKHHGAPVKFATSPWTRRQVQRALRRGPHKSCHEYMDFLNEEFIDMINKGQWIILPYSAVQHLPGLRVSPPGVVPQRERRPRWICDYSWWDVNADTLPLAAMEAMQFGHALDRILREILLADPSFGPVHLIKLDISDGFYRIAVNVDDIPKLGVIYPTPPGAEPLIAFPLVLPMGWTNSPPIFSTATETIADLANMRLRDLLSPLPHHLDALAQSIPSPPPAPPSDMSLLPPIQRDPSLPTTGQPLAYTDVFVDDFVGAAQHTAPSPHSPMGTSDNLQRVRRILLHAIDDVLRPLEPSDPPQRREPVSIKKLRAGDCSWGTIKLVLGWIIDTENLTIRLPPHRIDRLAELLESIPRSQHRTSIKKWHQVLGELRSMAIALPGSRNIFSTMQNALATKTGSRVALHKGVHDALDDFRWIHNHISTRPTRIAELVPLLPVAEGHHDASGAGAGGIWFPSSTITPRDGYVSTAPVAWRFKWPQHIVDRLVTDTNPRGTITNSDLELAGGLLHLDALTHCFDIRERTVLSKGDNLATTFWERKGSTTSDKPPAYLLRLFGMHQRIHRYIPRFDYISGSSNHIADTLSRQFDKPWSHLIDSLSHLLPQNNGCQSWTPSKPIVSAVISALLRQPSCRGSLQDELLAPPQPGPSGSSSQTTWASTPFSKPSRTKYQSYKSLSTEFISANLQPTAIPSGLERLRITYGTLPRRSFRWGPSTHASTPHTRSTSVCSAH